MDEREHLWTRFFLMVVLVNVTDGWISVGWTAFAAGHAAAIWIAGRRERQRREQIRQAFRHPAHPFIITDRPPRPDGKN